MQHLNSLKTLVLPHLKHLKSRYNLTDTQIARKAQDKWKALVLYHQQQEQKLQREQYQQEDVYEDFPAFGENKQGFYSSSTTSFYYDHDYLGYEKEKIISKATPTPTQTIIKEEKKEEDLEDIEEHELQISSISDQYAELEKELSEKIQQSSPKNIEESKTADDILIADLVAMEEIEEEIKDIDEEIEIEEEIIPIVVQEQEPDPDLERRLFMIGLYRYMLRLAFTSYPGNLEGRTFAWTKVRSDFRKYASETNEERIDKLLTDARRFSNIMSMSIMNTAIPARNKNELLPLLQNSQQQQPVYQQYQYSTAPFQLQPTPSISSQTQPKQPSPSTQPQQPIPQPVQYSTPSPTPSQNPYVIPTPPVSQSSPPQTQQQEPQETPIQQTPQHIPPQMIPQQTPADIARQSSHTFSGSEVFPYSLKNKVDLHQDQAPIKIPNPIVQQAQSPQQIPNPIQRTRPFSPQFPPPSQTNSAPQYPIPQSESQFSPEPQIKPQAPSPSLAQQKKTQVYIHSPKVVHNYQHSKNTSSSEARNEFWRQYSELTKRTQKQS